MVCEPSLRGESVEGHTSAPRKISVYRIVEHGKADAELRPKRFFLRQHRRTAPKLPSMVLGDVSVCPRAIPAAYVTSEAVHGHRKADATEKLVQISDEDLGQLANFLGRGFSSEDLGRHFQRAPLVVGHGARHVRRWRVGAKQQELRKCGNQAPRGTLEVRDVLDDLLALRHVRVVQRRRLRHCRRCRRAPVARRIPRRLRGPRMDASGGCALRGCLDVGRRRCCGAPRRGNPLKSNVGTLHNHGAVADGDGRRLRESASDGLCRK
mmetsp:Transcript_55917/g.155937  ORF Transcript_55917/g.155937 Transcript_55917/m.155937 type:complete len:266 (+) Transcript_55917:753-1550(+)